MTATSTHRPDRAARLTWIDAVRGGAILLVVILHASLTLGTYTDYSPEAVETFNTALAPFRMPTLMFLSGLFVSRSLAKGTRTYFSGKLRNVAWPYLVWAAITLIEAGDITLEFVLRAVYNPRETHLWYLWFLIIFYGAAWLLRRVPPLVPAVMVLVASQWLPEGYRLEKAFFLFGFFLLGTAFERYRARLEPHLASAPVLLLAAAAAIAAGAASLQGWKVLYEPLSVPGVLGFLLLLMHLVPKAPPGPARSALEYIGRHSIAFYVSHLLVVVTGARVMSALGLTDPWLVLPTIVALALGVGTLISWASSRSRFASLLVSWPEPRTRRAVVRA